MGKSVDSWYSQRESSGYLDFEDVEEKELKANVDKFRNFSQIIWNTTRKCGFGVVVEGEPGSDEFTLHVVGRYMGGANVFNGEFKSHVAPRKPDPVPEPEPEPVAEAPVEEAPPAEEEAPPAEEQPK